VTPRLFLALVAVCACKAEHERPPPAPEPAKPVAPAPAPAIDRAALLEGKLPEGGPEVELINAQCRICHGAEYLTQQRLGEAAWQKTIAKMRKFGANVSDEQAASLAKFAASYWNPALPARTWKLGPPPPGALPAAHD
jgi:cytochrome c5